MSAPQTTPAAAPAYTLENFIELHKSQFENMKLPKFLWKVAYKKFTTEKYLFTEENAFELKEDADTGLQLYSTANHRRWADLWILPHVLTGTAVEIYNTLLASPDLVDTYWNMMNLDNLVVTPEEEAKAAKAAAKAAAKKAKADRIPAGAKPVVKYEADPTMVEVVMSEADVTRERAIQALEKSGNDMISAITECNLLPEFQALEKQMGEMLFAKFGDAEIPTGDDAEEEDEEEKEDEIVAELSDEEKLVQRAKTVFKALFQLDYVGFYMTMRPRAPDSNITGPPRPEEIIKNYYILDGLGSAVTFSNTPNVKMVHLVSLVHGGQGWTLMWPEKDIAAGDKIQREPVAKIPVPLDV